MIAVDSLHRPRAHASATFKAPHRTSFFDSGEIEFQGDVDGVEGVSGYDPISHGRASETPAGPTHLSMPGETNAAATRAVLQEIASMSVRSATTRAPAQRLLPASRLLMLAAAQLGRGAGPIPGLSLGFGPRAAARRPRLHASGRRHAKAAQRWARRRPRVP